MGIRYLDVLPPACEDIFKLKLGLSHDPFAWAPSLAFSQSVPRQPVIEPRLGRHWPQACAEARSRGHSGASGSRSWGEAMCGAAPSCLTKPAGGCI